MEKEFVFEISEGNSNGNGHRTSPLRVKESELTESQKQLLIGDTIHKFNSLPESLKNDVIEGLKFNCHCNRELIFAVYCSICDNDE